MTRHIVFFVDSVDRRTDALAAARALGRALRRHGSWRTTVVASAQRRGAPSSVDVAVATVPTVDPRWLPAGAVTVAWIREEVDRWLARPDLAAYDLVLAPSTLALAALRERRAGPSALLLPAVNPPVLRMLRRGRRVMCRRGGPDLAYGVVDGDLLRALAADMIPLTNSALGFSDLGLDELAAGPDGRGRPGVVTRVRDGQSLIRELGQEVRERHSWRRRAAEFIEHVDRAREESGTRAVLGFYPDFRSTNAFQEMLYSRAAEAGVDVLPLRTSAADLAPHYRGRSLDRYVVHVHWTSAVLSAAENVDDAATKLRTFERRVRDLKSRGGRLVWTVHNVLPHENRYPDLELRLNRFLAKHADLVHVMNPDTAELTKDLYELPADRIKLVPHASYVGVYPDAMSREHARHRLGIPPSDLVVLYAGSIRPYKGLDVLLDAFDAALEDEPRLRLIVAGRVNQFAEPDAERLIDRISGQRRCVSRLEHIPDHELQAYYRAADVAVLPYRTILNSGSMQLALSFAVPVLAPSLPSLHAQLDPAWSETFQPESVEHLRRALLRVRRLATPAAQSAAWERAAAYRAQQMSWDFFAAFHPIIHQAA